MGIGTILKTKKIILIANGYNKAQAIKDMIEKPWSLDCPASALQLHNNVEVFLDQKAASLLKNKN